MITLKLSELDVAVIIAALRNAQNDEQHAIDWGLVDAFPQHFERFTLFDFKPDYDALCEHINAAPSVMPAQSTAWIDDVLPDDFPVKFSDSDS